MKLLQIKIEGFHKFGGATGPLADGGTLDLYSSMEMRSRPEGPVLDDTRSQNLSMQRLASSHPHGGGIQVREQQFDVRTGNPRQ